MGQRICKVMLVGASILGFAAQAADKRPPSGEAPKQGMAVGAWSSGNKQFFGTAFEAYDSNNTYSLQSSTAPISKVWFTGARGILSEVFWPTVDNKQVRDAEILATDGKTFFYEEKSNSDTTIEWASTGVPAYKVTNREKNGRFSIEKTIYTDPEHDSLLVHYRIIKNVEGLRFFYMHNPAVADTTRGDTARVVLDLPAPRTDGLTEGMYAWEGSQAQAVLFSIPLKQASAGFEAANDGYQDISHDLSMDSSFEYAKNGNVVTTGWLDIDEHVGIAEFDVAVGFGDSALNAHDTAKASLTRAADALTQYSKEWKAYQASVRDLSAQATDGGKLFRASVAVLKSMEDKTYAGAYVASPTIPWGEYRNDDGTGVLGKLTIAVPGARGAEIAGYHLVWPRDLFQMATTFLSIDDPKSAIASLNYYKHMQYTAADGNWQFGFRVHSRAGSFPQNCWVNGDPYWTELQMDQTAFPIILTHRIWKAGRIQLADYWDMVKAASDFIADYGPWSRQERWEENFGVTPSSVAAEISALWLAAEIAETMGDHNRAIRYHQTADAWNSKPNDNLETWVFTETGGFGNGKYYERIEGAGTYDQVWNPNDETGFFIGNGGGWHREKDILDGGFLELVRYGVRDANDYHVLETMHEYDSVVRKNTTKGPGFYRYTGDHYNYDDDTGANTPGMLWPLLTGERGQYEIASSLANGASADQVKAAAVPYIQAMEQFATPSLMIPEQVWDTGPRQGLPTGAATPLGWAHGEYIKLLASRQVGFVGDTAPEVVRRAKFLKDKDWPAIQKLR